MQQHFSRYKHRFGQHFLNSRRIAQRIVDFADVHDAFVIEIGAGKGMMTRLLAAQAKRVVAFEIDRRLARMLKKESIPKTRILEQDFLEVNLDRFSHAVAVGNIPYGISTAIIRKLVAERAALKKAVLTVQKEYARRLLAEIGTRQYGALTMFVRCYFDVRKGFAIPSRFFSPPPKVNSMVIALEKRKPLVAVSDEKKFFEFVDDIFRYRRKSLKNAIASGRYMVPAHIDKKLLMKRPAHCSLHDFYHIFMGINQS